MLGYELFEESQPERVAGHSIASSYRGYGVTEGRGAAEGYHHSVSVTHVVG